MNAQELTQADINALALSLDITPKTFPWLWRRADGKVGTGLNIPIDVRLPSPLSDEPAGALWVGPMLAALAKANSGDISFTRNKFTPSWYWEVNTDRLDREWETGFRNNIPQAALYTALKEIGNG